MSIQEISDKELSIQERIMRFFVEKGKADGLDPGADLFKGGFVDSLFALEIVAYIEKEFKIRLKNKDINENNFKTVENMAAVVGRYIN